METICEVWTQRRGLKLKVEEEYREEPSCTLPEEFEVWGEMKVTTETTKCLLSQTPDLINSILLLIGSRIGGITIIRQNN